MRCSRAVKGEGKKPKFGECVRARERGESFTCGVHPRSEKAGAFLDLAGEKRAKVRRCFRFPSSSFELQSIGDLVAWDVERYRRARWEWVCALAHGARAQRVQCGEEKTQRATLL